MSINKFEQDSLKQINELQESLASRVMKFLLKPRVKKLLKKLEDDPEFKASMDAIDYHTKDLQKQVKSFEKQYGKKPKFSKLGKFSWEK